MPHIKNTVIYVLIMLVTLSALFTGCAAEKPAINAVIDINAAYDMIQANKNNPDFVLIDVRTKEEFNIGHIEGAEMIDIYLPDFKARISKLDRNKKYLVYCRTARRSAEAAKLMKDLGFSEVYDMAGGITEWSTAKLPVIMG